MNDLLDAVDSLTKPVHVRVSQEILRTKIQPDGRLAMDPEGNLIREVKGTQVIQVEHPPLLEQLEAAIRGDMNPGSGSSMSRASTRDVINSDAMYLHARIDSQIKDWCRMVGIASSGRPQTRQRYWYVARLTVPEREASDEGYRRILQGWARQIEALLAPPRTREMIAPCPACGSDVWLDSEGVPYRHPVKIEYRPGGPADDVSEEDLTLLAHAQLSTARAECRACRAEWVGSPGIRALAWEVHEHEESHRSSGFECAGQVAS